MADWTINRVVFSPQQAADLLNEMEARNTRHNQRVTELLEANNRYLQDARNWRIIQDLRADEGAVVTICCDNPDFNGQPNCKAICLGDWTAWQDEIFTGDTIDEALGHALVAFNKWKRENG